MTKSLSSGVIHAWPAVENASTDPNKISRLGQTPYFTLHRTAFITLTSGVQTVTRTLGNGVMKARLLETAVGMTIGKGL